MSTQHPDNVHTPFFAENTELGGEDEIQEAYYVFSHLSCDEQMWDCEGKEVDNFVVKKLLSWRIQTRKNVEGISLPRAITFTSALYSIGLPPEILGLNALNEAKTEQLYRFTRAAVWDNARRLVFVCKE